MWSFQDGFGGLMDKACTQADHHRGEPEGEERREKAGSQRDGDEDAGTLRFRGGAVGGLCSQPGGDAAAAVRESSTRSIGQGDKVGQVCAAWDGGKFRLGALGVCTERQQRSGGVPGGVLPAVGIRNRGRGQGRRQAGGGAGCEEADVAGAPVRVRPARPCT